jgi:formylmethanofuran dehydrogenase subunit A
MATQDELNKKNQESLARQRATRERRSKEAELKKFEKQLMGKPSVMESTKLQREAMAKVAEESKRLGLSSAGGDERGGIYDVSTDNYSQPENNQQSLNDDTANKGIDVIKGGTTVVDGGGDGGVPDGYVETSVTLCQNGSPVTGSILFQPD